MVQKPRPGDDLLDYLSQSSLWIELADVLGAYHSGALRPTRAPAIAQGTVLLTNTTDQDFAAGQLAQIKPITPLPTSGDADTDTLLFKAFATSPSFAFEAPAWHGKIDNAIALQSDVATGQSYEHRFPVWGVVLVTGYTAGDRYVMPDPDDPTKCKSGSGGLWKVLGYDGHDRCIVDFTNNQTLWRYELNEATLTPETTNAKLLTLDGTTFADSIELSDPLSIGSVDGIGYEGYCQHVGNAFHIAPGPC